jgi:hypothetical protein
MTKLTKAQEAKMKEHKKHHTAKHMKDMRTAMVGGKTFTQAHTIAKKAMTKKKAKKK